MASMSVESSFWEVLFCIPHPFSQILHSLIPTRLVQFSPVQKGQEDGCEYRSSEFFIVGRIIPSAGLTKPSTIESLFIPTS